MLKKNIVSLSLLSLSSIALAQSPEWVLPQNYTKDFGNTPNGYFYSIEYEKDAVIFVIALQKKPFPWITKCFRSKPKGILETKCHIMPFDINQKDQNGMSILIDQTRSIVIFKPMDSIQVNYKIDSQPIISTKNDYILNTYKQNQLLDALLRGSKITYSFKKTNNSSFSSKTHDLSGIGYHVDFSNEFVRLNN